LRILVWEVLANIAISHSAQQGITERMREGIRIGMPLQAVLMLEGYPAQDQRTAFDQPV
jgi:hypothetical protein